MTGPDSVRAVLFDFGSTLFGHASLAETIARCAGALGAPISSPAAAALARRIDEEAHSGAELLHPRDLDTAVWHTRWPHLYRHADEHAPGLGAAVMADMHAPAQWLPYAETGAVLRALAAAGIGVGVVSNTGWDIRAAFAHHGFDTVDAFVLSYEVGAVKPQPEIFAAACDALGTTPAETLMVGDDARADSGAVTVGMRVLLLPVVTPGADNALRTVLRIAAV